MSRNTFLRDLEKSKEALDHALVEARAGRLESGVSPPKDELLRIGLNACDSVERLIGQLREILTGGRS